MIRCEMKRQHERTGQAIVTFWFFFTDLMQQHSKMSVPNSGTTDEFSHWRVDSKKLIYNWQILLNVIFFQLKCP